MVQLIKHDLEFILKQIKIAEAHAAGGDLATLVAGYNGNDGLAQAHLLPYGLRTVDGSYNNLLPGRENWGASDQAFPGIFTPQYMNDADGDRYDFNPMPNGPGADGVMGTADDTGVSWYTNNDYANAGGRTGSQPGPGSGTVIDADPRIISNLVVDQTLDNPAAIAAGLTHAGMSGPALMNALGEIVAAHKAVKASAPTGGAEPSAEHTAAKTFLADKLAHYGVEMDGNTVFLPNVSPDEGLSSPFNGWMTIFGQFFDHGLDLVAKGGNGTVYVPLSPDDPLYVPGGQNYIPLTRVSVNPGADGVLGTADDGLGPKNLTTPWVDQNQTYASTASKQVFMREYILGPDGKPMATGHLLEGERGGLATWADLKHQAKTVLGIELTDLNVGNIPLIAADPYGNFIPGPNGYPQLVVGMGPDGKLGTADDILREGNPAAPVSVQGVVLTGHAFLDDIAHAAVPVVNSSGNLVQDSDTGLGYFNADGTAGPQGQRGATAYDNELLDRHFIAGDGRANENIALTAVHQVFHSEHNRVVDMTKAMALQSMDRAFINEWLLTDLTDGQYAIVTSGNPTALLSLAETLHWDGERLFQVGRFTNEMEYQHLVFEEFGRMMQPDIDAFVFEPSADINPSIAAEFAHVVYRFGHSMLRQDIGIIKMVDGKPVVSDVSLFDGFLNPVMYDSLGDAEAASGAIIRGMSRQTGSEIDEFVTDVLRNQLLGIPLDLATINLARGRDVGMPSLQTARTKFFEATGDTLLKPYESWADFALNLKNPASIINFIAAYGTHSSLENTQTNPKTIEQLREAATLLVLGGAGAPADRLDFLNGIGAYANDPKLGGLNDIDFWIGGLAEKKMAFGGMLGSTFSFVFQMTMENLQDADRFYYLSRTQGLNLLNELENNTFAELVMRNTDLGDENSTALPGNLFSAFQMPQLEMDISKQLGADPTSDDPFLGGFSKLVERIDSNNDGIAEYIRVNSNEHFVIGGTEGADTIVAGGGDDAIWGKGGDDKIEAGYGVDKVFGGQGDDIITNAGTDIGEADFLHGNEGNDVIHGGSGLSLIFGNQGNDFIVTGPDGKEAFGGTGNDFILGGTGGDFLLGNEGDDWIEGGQRFDTLAGENSELFFNSTIIGHDVLNGGSGDTDYDGESGDDIMFQNSEGIQRSNGMAGFDWAVHKGDSHAANSDLGIPIFDTQEAFILRDRFDLVEGLSGWKNSDTLTGRAVPVNTRAEAEGTAAIPGPDSPLSSYSNDLLAKNVALINGLSGLVAHLGTGIPVTRVVNGQTVPVLDENGNQERVILSTADASDILLGGGGSDIIKGLAGNDIIDGDKWLNVRIRFVEEGVAYTVDEMAGKVYREADYMNGEPIQGAVPQLGGRLLTDLMFDRTVNPGQLEIVREIVSGNKTGDIDTAVYTDVVANYSFGTNSDGSIFVSHTGFVQPPGNDDLPEDETQPNMRSDGRDTIRNIEKLQFSTSILNVIEGTDAAEVLNGTDQADLIVGKGGSDVLNGGAGNDILIGGTNPAATSVTFADNFDGQASYTDNNGTGSFNGGWTETNDAGGPTGGDVRISGGRLQFATGTGGNETIQRSFSLAGVTSATLSFDYQADDLDQGENVVVEAFNGTSWDVLATLGGDVSNPFSTSLSLSHTAIRFRAVGTFDTGIFGGDENFYIDNLVITATTQEVLNGGSGDDTYVINLGDGTDLIQETSGNDRIVIGAGTLTGLNVFEGAGGDLVLQFNGQQVTVADHFETAGEAVERINLNGASYEGYAFDGDYVVSQDDTGTRTANAGENTLLAGSAGANALAGDAGDDLLFGHDSSDNLDGGDGDDLLVGGAGNDTLVGGLGADVMVGGSGNDTYSVDDADDVVVEVANGGTDEVQTDLAIYTLGANVENLTYTGAGTFNGTGNDLGNRMQGGAGIDTLAGGAGNDTYVVTAGDVIVEVAGGGTDTVESDQSYTLGANLENLTLTGANAVNGIGNDLANVINGNNASNQLFGGGGNDTVNGGDSSDLIDGGTGDDVLSGGTGNDTDTIIGGAGNDTIDVSNGNDVVRYTASGFSNDIINGFDANAQGGQDLIDLSALGVTAANFSTRVQLQDIEDGTVDDTLITVRDAENNIMGTIRLEELDVTGITVSDFLLAPNAPTVISGSNTGTTINGTNGADIIDGNLGNDTINASGGDDTIIWNANTTGATDGRDVVNGGTEGSAGDTFVINGNATAETYRIYTRAAFDAVPGNTLFGIAASTEIIVTRNGTNGASVIAELAEIEEIRINGFDPAGAGGAAGGDTFQIFGDFSGTNLRLNTITILGDEGSDTVDISELTSAHRVVFRSKGGSDTIVGTLRPQDVIELEPGRKADDYTWTENGDGTTTIACGAHTVTFKCDGRPTLAEASVSVEEGVVTPDPVEPGPAPSIPEQAGPDPVRPPMASVVEDLVLQGNARHNRLSGGDGNDSLVGRAGDDRLHGHDGHDKLWGGSGNDRLKGGQGDDRLSGGQGNDRLDGGAGDDRMAGNGGNDVLRGGAGDDVLKGGGGQDRLFGGLGDDRLAGGSGSGDRMTGGSGEDTFVFQKGMGRDFVTDFRNGEDMIDVSGLGKVNGISDLALDQVGNDVEIRHGSDVLVLEGVSIAQLDSKDFAF
ncbi:peroxidase family protein [Microvirga pudoricolor]|uniref:peroxidase family protein n=1 Tax=Microvirga pudoricolor TaxID=2778729 RepID=UPI00194FDAEA|nr:peroxidase family protein [Microvirga pudoricolor]MBM6596402.1 hypothetical protein [Microvirga pudoricolor]